jgi:hypothetical protein
MAVSLFSGVTTPVWSQAAAPSAEDDLKAAFLLNFGKYVDWPATAAPADRFHLCAVAEPDFLKRIDEIIATETIQGRPVARETPETLAAARGCAILFIGDIEESRVEHLIDAVRDLPVLTVGESSDFLARGGMIAFVRDGDRIRFDVNNAAAQTAGLTISSRLLRLARKVGGPGLDR